MNTSIPSQIRRAMATQARPLVRIVLPGDVDHGKLALIGQLLHETGNLPDGMLESLKTVGARRGLPFEWSFLVNALRTERDQGIATDTGQIRFRTRSRDFVLIAAPDQSEFLRNMIASTSPADAAILIVDAAEGVREQTRQHSYLLHVLGIQQLVVVVSNMDRIAYDAGRFREIETEITAYLTDLGLAPAAVIPVSVRDGVGITQHTVTLEWYRPTVVETLETFSAAQVAPEQAQRIPVQAGYTFHDRRV